MEKSENKVGFIAKYAKVATVCAVLFGATSGILGRLITAPAMAIGFWRLTIALPFFIIPALSNSTQRDKLKAISPKDYMWCFISGAFLFAHFFSWFNAVKLTNIASAAVLASLHPLVVLLVTIFIYKKRVNYKAILAILVALAGGAVIVGVDYNAFAGGNLKGNIFAFLAAMFMGLYFSVGDAVRKRVDGGLYVLLVFFSCWICFIIGNIVTGTELLGYPAMDYVMLVAMALMCQIGAHAVFNLCIGHVSSLYVSTWETGDAVFSTIFAVIFLSQIPKGYEIIGCIIVVCALLYYNRQES
ncbi:MAG: DMT family transporter [Firmicutes bacterium]|nr:DMT family transporter [Bacillota bacterium]